MSLHAFFGPLIVQSEKYCLLYISFVIIIFDRQEGVFSIPGSFSQNPAIFTMIYSSIPGL